eukprot:TRINITY_DN2021_c0_g1_i1.p1 TRINITY_DN2021_c0_g1~~TRINITY_DN2021_c0_g1_i1.p1  ORF type:complete len:252 (+),score=49.14 TRINITY_DN2021_c0_g1_i1:26-757(+)
MDERRPLIGGSSWATQAAEVRERVSEFAGTVRTIEDLSSRGESAMVRNNLRDARDRATRQFNELSSFFQAEEKKSRSQQDQRSFEQLRSEFSAVAGRLRVTQGKQGYQEQHYDGWGAPPQVEQSVEQQQGFKVIREESLDRAIIAENNAAYQHLQNELGALNDVYRDMAEMVGEQGQALNKAEDNVDAAEEYTGNAVTELQSALEYTQGARKKMFLIALCTIVVLVVIVCAVGGFLAYYFLKK